MCSRLLTMSRSHSQKPAVEFATGQKAAQETEVSQELNGQMGSFSCQDEPVCNFFATWLGQQQEDTDFLQTIKTLNSSSFRFKTGCCSYKMSSG